MMNLTLKRKISMWPLCYHHILAAGKLRSIDSNIRLKGYYNNAINVRQRDWDQVRYLWTGMALKYGKQVDAEQQYQMELFWQLRRSFSLQK